MDVNKKELQIIIIALERSVNYMTDKQELFKLVNRLKENLRSM